MVATTEPQAWTRRRLWVTAACLMLFQAGVIFWLGDPPVKPIRPRPASLVVNLPLRQAETLALVSDPTLFVRPNQHGYSGPAWMRIPPVAYPSLDLVEPALQLPLRLDRLGGDLLASVQTNGLEAIEITHHPEPRLENTEFYPALNLTPGQSTLRVEGDLANRPLIGELTLKSWATTNEIVLPNSVVLISVAPDGKVFSVVPLTQTGLKEADDEALMLARSARFEPLHSSAAEKSARPGLGLTLGKLIFQWYTLAPPPANAAAAAP